MWTQFNKLLQTSCSRVYICSSYRNRWCLILVVVVVIWLCNYKNIVMIYDVNSILCI